MICPMPGHPTQKDTVPRGMSKLDDNITQSGSMLEESRDDIWISIAHSKEVKKSVVNFPPPPPVPHWTLQHHLKIKLVKFSRLFQHYSARNCWNLSQMMSNMDYWLWSVRWISLLIIKWNMWFVSGNQRILNCGHAVVPLPVTYCLCVILYDYWAAR